MRKTSGQNNMKTEMTKHTQERYSMVTKNNKLSVEIQANPLKLEDNNNIPQHKKGTAEKKLFAGFQIQGVL